MDPTVKLVIEVGCVTGTLLLAAFSTPLLSGKRLHPSMLLPWAGGLVYLVFWVFINPRGGPDPFPVLVGGCIVVGALVGLIDVFALAWRWFHRGSNSQISAKTARDFGALAFFGILAGACLVGVIAFGVVAVLALGDDIAYRTAPDCASSASSSCRSVLDGTLVETRAESSRGRHWIDVASGGKVETIEVETAYEIWQQLAAGQDLQLTRWRGNVTQVTRAGLGTMQTVDSPGWHLVIAGALFGICFFGFVIFGIAGLLYWIIWRADTRGIYVPEVA